MTEIISEILGSVIVGIYRVRLTSDAESYVLHDTLALELKDGSLFELINRQDGYDFFQTDLTKLCADFDLSAKEVLALDNSETQEIQLPLHVWGICQVFSGTATSERLLAIALFDRQRHCVISVILETDEIELVPFSVQWERLFSRPYDYDILTSRWISMESNFNR
jgi:hypothetical protein